ncbi:MAG: hypothetical protein U0992_17520 [Planctomycetaceae bacterium]
MIIPAARPKSAPVAVSGRFNLRSVQSSLAAIAAQARDGGGTAVADAPRGRLQMSSNPQLVPITNKTLQRIRANKPEVDSGPYRIAAVPIQQPKRRRKKAAGLAKRVYRGQTNWVLKALQKINDFAYLISTPFILVLMIGVLLKRRDVAVIGATGIILPNLGRFVVNGAYLVIAPFKDSPIQGVLFFIPPFTFFYLYKHWKRMKKATLQFISPAIPILAVLLVFAFVPWIKSGQTPEGASLSEQMRTELGTLQSDVQGQVEKVTDLEQVQKLKAQAQEGLDELSQNPTVQDLTNRAREGAAELQRQAGELTKDPRVQELRDKAQQGVDAAREATESELKKLQESKPEDKPSN